MTVYLAPFSWSLIVRVAVRAVGGLARVGTGARDHVRQRRHTAAPLAAASLPTAACNVKLCNMRARDYWCKKIR